MCLIVHKYGKDSVFTLQQFDNMINANRDGLGIMYVENGRVKVEKCIGTEKEKRELWLKHRDKNHYVMHSRLATHGSRDKEGMLANCHPYEILNMDKGDPIDLYMVHNGVITGIKDVDIKMSDTWNFIEGVIKPMVKADISLLWQNQYMQHFIDRGIGSSKLVFLSSKAMKHNISDKAAYYSLTINQQAGDTVNGCWLSNLHSVGMYKSTRWENGRQVDSTNYFQNKETKTSTPKKDDKVAPEYTSWWDKFRVPFCGDTDEVANDTQSQTNKDEAAEEELLTKLSDENKKTDKEAKEKKLKESKDKLDKTFPTRNKSIVLVADKNRVVGDICSLMPTDEKARYALTLQNYKQCKDNDIEDFIRECPEDAASIIFYFAENLGERPYEKLIEMCSDAKQYKDVVNMIRHCDVKNAA